METCHTAQALTALELARIIHEPSTFVNNADTGGFGRTCRFRQAAFAASSRRALSPSTLLGILSLSKDDAPQARGAVEGRRADYSPVRE